MLCRLEFKASRLLCFYKASAVPLVMVFALGLSQVGAMAGFCLAASFVWVFALMPGGVKFF